MGKTSTREFYENKLRDTIVRDAMLLERENNGETKFIKTYLDQYPRYIRRELHKYFWKNEKVMSKIYTQYKKQEEEGPYNIFIFGNAARGKTVFACCLALYMQYRVFLDKREKNPDYPYLIPKLKLCTEGGILENLQDKIASGKSASTAEYKTIPFMVLDDLGATKPTDWGLSQMYLIMNQRLLDIVPTILTANKSLEELIDFYQNDRLVHRLYGVQVHAKDLGVFEIL